MPIIIRYSIYNIRPAVPRFLINEGKIKNNYLCHSGKTQNQRKEELEERIKLLEEKVQRKLKKRREKKTGLNLKLIAITSKRMEGVLLHSRAR